ncbi:glyoxalase [Tsuneonella deserti]|uniref:Glyoxalase n=1 Tax=Tsuneonella deserti TaxID=2035528 RepID=A0ABQ1S7E8_9SPHN|nr:VOC family protein [Tsuneonella deserti]GGD96882.1 glyoxalase [Tsuneonella deserti]
MTRSRKPNACDAEVIVGFDHVQLSMPTGGEEQARAFYCGVLGFTEREKPAALAGRGGCWFQSAGAELHLGVADPFHPSAKAHPALLVSDLDALRAAFDRTGVPFTEGIPLPGYVRGDVRDPFGNRIELMQKIGDGSSSGTDG